jgi:hypothetical protein
MRKIRILRMLCLCLFLFGVWMVGLGSENAFAEGGEPAYKTFGRYNRFEPSAVALWPGTSYVVVLNDRSKWTSPISVFKMGKKGGLKEIARPIVMIKGKALDISKFEGITASQKKPGVFYATTAFDRPVPSFRIVVRFELQAKSKGKKGKKVSIKMKSAKVMKFRDPSGVIKAKYKMPWYKIEALALTPEEDALIVGVRTYGKSYKKPQFRVLLLRYDLKRVNKDPSVLAHFDLKGLLGREEGISALEYLPERKQYLLVTSYENDDASPPTAQVGGHLWLVSTDLTTLNQEETWKKAWRQKVTHKPEGVTPLGGGKILVVYDDDNDRKSKGKDKPGTFPMQANEAAYSIITLPAQP